MAISTETENLIKLYTQKIELDQKQIDQVNLTQNGYVITTGIGTTDNIKIWGPGEVIETYNVPIKNIDDKIIEINSQIIDLQNQVLAIGQQANSVGCGTVYWSVGYTTETVYEDVLKYKGYSFSGNNPFNETQGNLTSGNSGIGTYNIVVQVSIGTYYGPINICNDIFQITCNNTICAGYATSIVGIQSSISTLQSERNGLISKVNFLKTAKIQPELQNYAYEQSKVKLNESIGISSSILNFLQDPANDEFL